MATFTVNDRVALAGSNTDGADYFLLWDTSASTHKKISRAEMRAMFIGAGNVANNTAVGGGSLAANTTGFANTAFGYRALEANTIGDSNTGLGREALRDNTTGKNNTAVGYAALAACTTGQNNTAFGYAALAQCSGGVNNVALGYNSLGGLSTGGYNVAVGLNAGATVTTGAQNTCIGYSAGGPTTGTNNTVIGYNASCSAAGVSNEITLGNSSISALRCQVTTITSLSDERDKKNIRPFDLGLDLLLSIEPKWFEWNMRDGGKVDVTEAGFIAQQLQAAVALHAGAAELGLVYDANPDRLEATPGKLTPVFVKAFHDLNARLTALEAA